ncbi:MAG: serine acetyltransferase [Erysipelotrichaceae bacterium]|nr:serine acetyltransferase [Erysipelotrichaceae bacterium]
MKDLKLIETKLNEIDNKYVDLTNINKKNIIEFINELKALLFPKVLKRNLSVKRLYIELYEILNGIDVEEVESITNHFFDNIIDIKSILIKDVLTFVEKDPACKNSSEVVFSYNSFHAIFIYRVAHLLNELNVEILPRFLTEYAHSITGIDIHPGCNIGENFFIDHGTGIVIGETTIIGDNVSLYQGVTLGAKSLKDAPLLRGKKRHPTISNNVVIYANTTILGGDTIIKENSVIPGNSFITKSN